MQRKARSEKGFTTMELLVVVGVLAILGGLSVPLMSSALQRVQANGAADALATAIRDARMRAIATGWQYRMVAFDASGAVPNAFRVEGSDTGAVWPAVGTATGPPVYGSTQMNEAYSSMVQDYGGSQIAIPAGGPTFTVTFDSRGQWVSCVPVGCQIQTRNSQGGNVNTLMVSQAGAVAMN